ncbi:MAG: hypothetical protein HN742_28120 [Lentisphaerae bacterium]|nr:hypothetical protein [Lentisphaerota bacterium]MBT5611498.1 hypothetical protein [Lentisphaerota bacterium]MBT7845772.1 hypothetical protein [Lentisphaerota bacterium]
MDLRIMTNPLLAVLLTSSLSAALAATPDLTWQPKPFVFRAGASIRYIDFENGDDANSGTKKRPWKHHPWDKSAKAESAACKGVHTYCFKKGVAYRGALVAKESGKPGNPIRLTVDPSWGTGAAGLYGSVKIEGGWKTCTDVTGPGIPESGRSRTWYVDLDKDVVPRLLWEVREGQVTRIPIARSPNWSVSNPDDPRGEWWELTGAVLEVRLDLDTTKGFAVGDYLTGTGRWDDRDENRDNVSQGHNRLLEVTDECVRIDSWQWKKGEFKRGATVTNGRVQARITGMSGTHDLVSRLIDTEHLTQQDPAYWIGATMWSEGVTMPKPDAETVTSYSPAERSVSALFHRNVSGPTTFCRYMLEGLPQLLDAPGEYCYVKEGEHAGRLYLRLPNDRDPNQSIIEAAREDILLSIRNQSWIEVTGLDIRFGNSIAPGSANARHAPQHCNAIHIVGTCSDITVRACEISHLANGVISYIEKQGDVLDEIEVADCDLHDIDGGAVDLGNGRGHYLLKDAGGRVIHARILRNRARSIGARRLHHWGAGLHALNIEGGEVVEVAGNVTDTTYGAGIRVFVGGDYSRGKVERPFIRSLIHHNKVTNSLLGLQDYGGIASWMAGPSYVYNNISGNAVGYKHRNWRGLDRRDWYRTSCYGVGLYIDGQYKGYVFNNILWGKNNNVNDRIYNSCGFNEAMGFLNTVFNNTIFRFGVGLHKGMTQHNRCHYLGNLMLDIGHKFIQQEPRDDIIEADTLAWTGNVFNGAPANFGQLGSAVFQSLEQWQAAMGEGQALAGDAGILAAEPQTLDAAGHDFRLRPDAKAIDAGAKAFVPWSLYAVVGEWGFYKSNSDPTLITGENINMNDEWVSRSMFQEIPRNDLRGHGIDASNYTMGTLENWVAGALTLNGIDEFCALPDAELKRGYTWSDPRSRTEGAYPAGKRVTVDMGSNSFLIEVVLKTEPGLTRGGVVSKRGSKGYVLEIAESGGVEMRLDFGNQTCSRTSTLAINDAKWHHIIAEVDRDKPDGINLYVDGEPSNGEWSGHMDRAGSLANSADFVVGKTQPGASGDGERYFAGQLDFARVSRGTLADAETTIEELYTWEFDGPATRDFSGQRPRGKSRDAGAVEFIRR